LNLNILDKIAVNKPTKPTDKAILVIAIEVVSPIVNKIVLISMNFLLK
jgi:hypothetical protein